MSNPTSVRNTIIQRLPPPDADALLSQMERISPPLWEVVSQAGTTPKWVHFPESGVLSSMVVLEDGSTVEGSTVGNEGMDGLYLIAEGMPNPYKINVQVEGDFLRIAAPAFRQAMTASPALRQLLLRYALVLIQRGAQNAACIQHHTIEERMCRWLLETAHRKGADRFGLTQEFLSDMLGVRRQSVNLTARVLQRANLITYGRGELTIVDRDGLEDSSCECFRVTSALYDSAMRIE